MIGYYNFANLITFLAIALGLVSIHFSITGQPVYAVVCLIAAGIADMFDGFVARKLSLGPEARDFGKQLDALTDVVAFCVAPSILWYCRYEQQTTALVVTVLYNICGIIRLAYFNVHGLNETNGRLTYTGLPVTFAALIFPVMFTLLNYLDNTWLNQLMLWLPLAVAVLFITPVPVPKPRGFAYIVFVTLAITVIVINLALWK